MTLKVNKINLIKEAELQPEHIVMLALMGVFDLDKDAKVPKKASVYYTIFPDGRDLITIENEEADTLECGDSDVVRLSLARAGRNFK